MAVSPGRSWWTLGGRRVPEGAARRSVRPPGPLVWLHVAGPASVSGMRELAVRLSEEEDVAVLMTGSPAEATGVLRDQLPAETAAEVRAFLDHWHPEAAVFSEGEIRPVLLHEAAERRLPVLLADARDPHLPRGRESWIPGAMRRALAAFTKIYAIDAAAARAFRKAGAAQGKVTIAGRLEESSSALPCLEAEREYLAKLMVARPVWFGAGVPEGEEAAVIEAQRQAMQMAHRILLILMPQDPARAGPLARSLEEAGWRVASRNDESEPEADTEIYLVSDPAELGLWYRLAPITYLGGGLSGTGLHLSPLEPAALGSAIVHGPRPGAFGAPLGRLGAARAARAVASGRDLNEALGDLLSPDRAARLAQSAWAVVSEGAEVTENVLETLRGLTGARAATGGN